MDFSWNKYQKELKEKASKFARISLNEDVAERDKKGKFSRSGWNACVDFGLQAMIIPKRYGGMEFKPLDVVSVLEGIGFGCKDNGLIFSVNAHIWGCETILLHFGTQEQRKTYLPMLCNGKLIGANAMTEPASGSDVYSLKTIAEKQKDYYILNGSKTFVTNAPIADLFMVYARTGKGKGLFGISCFMVEKGTNGLSVGKDFEKMGLRTSLMADVFFDNCKVPKSSLVGKEGSGAAIFNDSMEWERIFILANCIGVIERLLDNCVRYVKERMLRDRPIVKNQSIANKIAEMKVSIETSRLLLYKAAWLKGNNISAIAESSIAKLYVSESYVQICRHAMQIYGGYGYMIEYEIERELRDALASTLYSGTSEIQKNIIVGCMGL